MNVQVRFSRCVCVKCRSALRVGKAAFCIWKKNLHTFLVRNHGHCLTRIWLCSYKHEMNTGKKRSAKFKFYIGKKMC